MPIWIPVTIAAAFFQNIRSATQRHLKGHLSTTGATFVRFGFGLPFVVLVMVFLVHGLKWQMPEPPTRFWFWVTLAAFAQISGQSFLLLSITTSNFTVGTAYSRTEAIQSAIIGLVLLGDRITPKAGIAILLSVAGVMLLAIARTSMTFAALVRFAGSKAARMGLASGFSFGISAVSYRAASLSLAEGMAEPNFLMQAATTLLTSITIQSVVLAIWMIVREPGQMKAIWEKRKWGVLAGFCGAAASLGWFIGFTLQTAGVIKALAQVEMIFTYISTIFIFKEKVTGRELFGCGLIVAGIIVLVL